MTGADYEKVLLALAAFSAAREDGIEAQIMIAQALLRRAKVIDDLTELLGEFMTSMSVEYPDSRDPRWLLLLRKIDDVYVQASKDTLPGGALWFTDLTGTDVDFRERIIAHPVEHPFCAVSGRFHFFA
jgi:hypothetical protein